MLDTFGLITREIADLPGAPGAKKAPDFIFDQAPEFIAFKKNLKLKGGIAADVRLFRDTRLRRDYDLVRIFSLGGPRLLLFQRRSEPVMDVRFDFVERFHRKLVGQWRDGTWHGVGPKKRLAIAQGRVQFAGKQRQRRLRRGLDAVVRGEGADFAGAEPMRRWLGQWRSWLEHRPEAKMPTAIRFRLEIPEKAFLRFGLGAPPATGVPEKGEPDPKVGVRYSILLEDSDGEVSQLFSATPRVRRVPGRRFEIDLRAYARRQVTFYFLAHRIGKGAVRFGWIEPLLIQRSDWDPEPGDTSDDLIAGDKLTGDKER